VIGFLISVTLIALIIVAAFAVFVKDIATSVVFFMGFGLGCTVLYFLFSAPDVALTEAVIGSGVSGVVLLVALLQTQKRGRA